MTNINLATTPENTSLNIIDILGRTIPTKTYNAAEASDLTTNTNGLDFIQLGYHDQFTTFKILKT